MQMQQEVQNLSALARTADLTTKMAVEKVERQVAIVQQQLQEQKMQSVQEAQSTKAAQETITQQLTAAQQIAESSMQKT